MNKLVVGAAITAVALGAGTVGALAWSVGAASGRLVEGPRTLAEALPFVKVKRNEVTRGLFSATHDVTLELGCIRTSPDAAPMPVELVLRDHVRSGALVDGTLAHVDTELVASDAVKAQLKRIFGSEQPMHLTSTAMLSGELVSELELAPVKVDDPSGSFSTGPIRLSTRVRTGQGGAYHMASDHPAIELSSKAQGVELRMHVGAGHGETDVGARPDPKLWFGAHQGSYRLASLGIDLSASGATAAPVPPLHVELSDARWTSQGTIKDGLYSTVGTMEVRGKAQGVVLDQLSVKSHMDRLAMEPYQRVLSRIAERVLSCDPNAQLAADALIDELVEAATEILKHDPELAIDPLRFVVGGKSGELAYSFGTRGVTAADTAQPVAAWLLTKGYVKARVAMDTGLVEQLVASVMSAAQPSGQPPTGGMDANLLGARLMVGQGIAVGVASGYLEQAGERVSASLAFEGGQLLLNGKPLPPELLQALGAGAAAGLGVPSGGP